MEKIVFGVATSHSPQLSTPVDKQHLHAERDKGKKRTHFAILAADQEAIAWQFAGRPQPDLEIGWEQTDAGPRLAGTLAYMECEPWHAYDGGDHTLIVGNVTNFSYEQGEALGFYCGKFHKVAIAM